MKITGSYRFDTTAARVWAVLTDPKALARCLPGCKSLDPLGDDEYQAVLSVGVGPFRSRYSVKVSLRDLTPHQSYRLVVQGTETTGFLNGEALITLVEQEGNTTVRVDSDSRAGETDARPGLRMMDRVAKTMMDRFFTCLQQAAR